MTCTGTVGVTCVKVCVFVVNYEIIIIYNLPIGLATYCCVGYSINPRISYATYGIVFKCTWGASPTYKIRNTI